MVDVSAKSSYDFHCKRATQTLRVEVKGTTGLGEEIILTKNEVSEGNQGGYALIVVAEIELNREKPILARGGICRLFVPWSPKPESLVPIAYTCRLDQSSGVVVDDKLTRDAGTGDNLLEGR